MRSDATQEFLNVSYICDIYEILYFHWGNTHPIGFVYVIITNGQIAIILPSLSMYAGLPYSQKVLPQS